VWRDFLISASKLRSVTRCAAVRFTRCRTWFVLAAETSCLVRSLSLANGLALQQAEGWPWTRVHTHNTAFIKWDFTTNTHHSDKFYKQNVIDLDEMRALYHVPISYDEVFSRNLMINFDTLHFCNHKVALNKPFIKYSTISSLLCTFFKIPHSNIYHRVYFSPNCFFLSFSHSPFILFFILFLFLSFILLHSVLLILFRCLLFILLVFTLSLILIFLSYLPPAPFRRYSHIPANIYPAVRVVKSPPPQLSTAAVNACRKRGDEPPRFLVLGNETEGGEWSLHVLATQPWRYMLRISELF
jgi:hypothetical protein